MVSNMVETDHQLDFKNATTIAHGKRKGARLMNKACQANFTVQQNQNPPS